MRSRRRPWLLTLLGIALFACASRAQDLGPRGRVVGDRASLDQSDVIPYRTLARADFKGRRPPPDAAPYVDRIGAATCAQILTTPDTQMAIQESGSDAGKKVFRAKVHHLAFFAQMDRNCSWWNPDPVGLPQDYILQHEQIHFALFELEARRLNASVPELSARLAVKAESPEAATRLAQQRLQEEIRKRLASILARSREFDEQTSMGHEPDAQQRWWKQVQSELAGAEH